MLIRSRMWMYDYFSAAINITQIRLYTMYFDSTGVATTLLANYTAAVSDTRQKPWRSRSCLSISCFFSATSLIDIGNCMCQTSVDIRHMWVQWSSW